MKIEFIDKSDDNVTLLLKETNPTEVNMIRRMIIDEVPTLAIEDVNFIKNSSALYDEIIAHRMGLIAIKTDLKSYDLPKNCKGKKKGEDVCTKENCPHHSVLFTLKSAGPTKDGETKIVYAEELVCKDKKIIAVHPKTPIVKLLKKHNLEVEARAVMGQGKDHMKFTPGTVYYRGLPSIKIGSVKHPESIAQVCPRKVYDINGGKLKVTDPNQCILCKACVDASEGKIEVKASDKDFIFNIESWGQLTHGEMLSKAIELMDGKLDEFGKELKKIK
ncbi:MAG: DNA-directed RNA polymerase subunit D [Nanoarchaeota archaeon]|nr:DNA-directed RNA polymerase subunit D [Nanoarchaeota archaeon]